MTDPQKMDRLRAVLPFARATGACGICALQFALAQVEREGGEPWFAAVNGEGCARKAHKVSCRDLAAAKWKELPKPNAQGGPDVKGA